MSIQMGNLKVKTSTEGRNKQTKKKQNTPTTTHPPRKKKDEGNLVSPVLYVCSTCI